LVLDISDEREVYYNVWGDSSVVIEGNGKIRYHMHTGRKHQSKQPQITGATIIGSLDTPFGFLNKTGGDLTIKDVQFRDFVTSGRNDVDQDVDFLVCNKNCYLHLEKYVR